MGLVHRLGGGSLFAGIAALATLAFAACANGTLNGLVVDGEGGFPEAGAGDGNIVPSKDGAAGDSGTKPKDSGSGACNDKVVINEVMVNGTGEFIELYNPTACSVAMSGWKISYRSSDNVTGGASYTFGSGESIEAGAFFVIGTSDFTGSKDATFNGGLGNSGGQLGLLDPSGTADGVGWAPGTSGIYTEGSPAALPAAGKSIARKADGVDTDDNASDFSVATPSPGAPN